MADNVILSIAEIDSDEKTTVGQQGAVFSLQPGTYELIVKDKGMKVSKVIEIAPGEREIRVDLQDIFNF